jgi:hypothetical protein
VTPNSVYDVNSEALSESGESEERWTPDETGRPIRRARKRTYPDGSCPICDLSIKPCELENHVRQEMERPCYRPCLEGILVVPHHVTVSAPADDDAPASAKSLDECGQRSAVAAASLHNSSEATANVLAAAQARLEVGHPSQTIDRCSLLYSSD